MDRIFEAYNGVGGFSREFSRKSRERIHWTCSHVQGSKVLDIGCSQGIGPILVGRMGNSVLGIDINPEAIAFAKKELEKESEELRRKVQFACDNFLQFKHDDWIQVDTIVMGEVLEHLVRPEAFIDKAFQLLKPSGRLIVTIPFGINDDPDHRQTFYLTNAYLLVAPCFEIGEIRFFGGWLGMVCTRRQDRIAKLPSMLPISLIAQAEEAFNKIERPLVDERTRASVLAKQLSDERKKTLDLTAKVTSLEAVAQRTDVVVVEDQIHELKTSLAVEQQTNAGQLEQIALLKAALQLASNQKSDAANETRLLEYSQEVKDLRASLDSKGTELAERAERCGRLAAECESSKMRVAALEAELEKIRKAFEGEATLRKKFSSEAYNSGKRVESLELRIKSLESELAEKSKKLTDVETRSVTEAKAHQESLAEAGRLGQQVEAQSARIKSLESVLVEQRSWAEQHKRESAAVQDRLISAESELAEKSKALTAIETKCASEEKAHRKFSSDAYKLGQQVEVLSARIKSQEGELAAQRSRIERYRRESAAVQDRLISAESELAEKSKAMTTIESKYAAEAKAHQKFSSEAFKLGKEKSALEQKIRSLVLERDGLRVSLKKSDAAYEKLSKAKLGRLTLKYWRWKDGFKSGRQGQLKVVESRPAKSPSSQSNAAEWKSQRENESKYFSKS